MSKVYIMGDIHGCSRGLIQCLERSEFNKEEDRLIQLGDIADGWSEVYQCVEELLTIKNLIPIKGNHDEWFLDFLTYGTHPTRWLQGGIGTLKSYCENSERDVPYMQSMGGYITSLCNADIPKSHIEFFKNQQIHFTDENNNFFTHGGFNRHEFIKEQADYIFCWDRDLWGSALSYKESHYKFKIKDNFKEVFIGHTATTNWKTDQPMQAANIWNLDTGAGWDGKLTIMNLETKEYFQSDNVKELYPLEKGRN